MTDVMAKGRPNANWRRHPVSARRMGMTELAVRVVTMILVAAGFLLK